MERRLFLQTLNAMGVSTVQTASADSIACPLSELITADDKLLVRLHRSIHNCVFHGEIVGVDFQDLRRDIFNQTGICAFGFAAAMGPNAIDLAANGAMNHPLLGKHRLQKAAAVLVTIEGTHRATTEMLRAAKVALQIVRPQMAAQASIYYGVTIKPDDGTGDFVVSILASGIQQT